MIETWVQDPPVTAEVYAKALNFWERKKKAKTDRHSDGTSSLQMIKIMTLLLD